jgi:serine/threonine-protein kinase RsbW
MLKRRKKRIEFSSTRDSIHLAERFVEEVCDVYNIFNNYFGNITLAVTEAVENAINHGNKNLPEKFVVLSFESSDAGLIFSITDSGSGFDPSLVPDPTEADSADAGRGIYLMRSLSDNLNFVDNGRTVELIFNIASINQHTTIQRSKSLRSYLQGETIHLNDKLKHGDEKN